MASPVEARKRDARAEWDAAASGWNEQTPLIRAWLAGATVEMLDMADVRPGMQVLDVAAGAGDQSHDIACRVGRDGFVLVTDVSPQMLAAAAINLRAAGHDNTSTLVADGEALGLDELNFDAATSRLGLMLMQNPLLGLQAVRRALRPGGRFCAMVFCEATENPCIGAVVSIAARHAGVPVGDPCQPGSLFSLGKPGLIEDIFGKAGFVDIRVKRLSAAFTAPSVAEYLEFIRASAGPVMALFDRMPPKARPAAWAEIAEALLPFSGPTRWEAPTRLLLAAGSR